MLIVLIGVSGAGKTTVGRLLADELGWPFYDADDFHPPANVAKMHAGLALTDTDRAPWLGALHTLLAGLAAERRSAVLACSALRQAYRDRIAAGIPDLRIVYLRGDPALLARRLADRRGHYMPAALLPSQLETLEEPRDALALEVTAPPEVIADRIRIGLGAQPARPPRPTSSDAGGPPGPPGALEVIRTERLLLTRIADDDFGDLCGMHRDPEVMRMLGGVRSDEVTVEVLRQLTTHWDEHGFGYWMARHRATGDFVGRGGLRQVVIGGAPEVEIGYALMPAYWGHGYATELARACTRVGFEMLGRQDLVAFTLPINQRSRRVMERTGFTYERDIIWSNLPHVLYRLSAARWRQLA